jgi:hypothetical protein
MDIRIKNSQQLSEFINDHDLRDSHSIIQFNSIVTITTAKNKITNRRVKMMITLDGFDSYGQLSIFDEDIDPHLYPTVFDAKWQQMKHVDKEYLEITDIHRKNPDIGKYNVKIIPLERLRS